MPTEGDDDRLLLARQHRRSWLRRSGPDVRNRATALPLANSLLVDAVALCERSQALLTMLYRSTDRLRRRGASMKNLAHSASFHSTEKIAPSKAGIKHLDPTEGDSAPSVHDHCSPALEGRWDRGWDGTPGRGRAS